MRVVPAFRTPLLHFLLAGALLFGLRAALLGDPSDAETAAGPARVRRASAAGKAASPIVIDAEWLAEIQREFEGEMGRRPTRGELERLIAAVGDEARLHREALARGLDEGDGAIAVRLVQKMRFLDDEAAGEEPALLVERARALGLDREDFVIRRILVEKLRQQATTLAPGERPSDAELARRHAERAESLREPERRSLVHVFFSRDRRGTDASGAASALAAELQASREADADRAASAGGDPFPLGRRFARRTRAELERTFGGELAARSFALPRGRWSDPVDSAYGVHLVRVDEIVPGEIPPFETVRERLRLELEEARRARKLEALLAELRTRYEVAVVWPEESSQ